MFDLVTNIRSGDVVVEALWIILDDDLALAFALVFPLYELFFNGVVAKRLHKRTELLLLIVTSRSTRVHKNRRTYYGGQNFRLFELPFIDVEHYQQVKVDPFVVVGC